MAARCRCAVCRRSFVAAATSLGSQKVCCQACRLIRRSMQARKRREEDLEGYRADERERQRRSRAHRRDAAEAAVATPEGIPPAAPRSAGVEGDRDASPGAVALGCHAPASVSKLPKLQAVIEEIVDETIRLSRTRFDRDLRRMARRIGPIVCAELRGGGS